MPAGPSPEADVVDRDDQAPNGQEGAEMKDGVDNGLCGGADGANAEQARDNEEKQTEHTNLENALVEKESSVQTRSEAVSTEGASILLEESSQLAGANLVTNQKKPQKNVNMPESKAPLRVAASGKNEDGVRNKSIRTQKRKSPKGKILSSNSIEWSVGDRCRALHPTNAELLPVTVVESLQGGKHIAVTFDGDAPSSPATVIDKSMLVAASNARVLASTKPPSKDIASIYGKSYPRRPPLVAGYSRVEKSQHVEPRSLTMNKAQWGGSDGSPDVVVAEEKLIYNPFAGKKRPAFSNGINESPTKPSADITKTKVTLLAEERQEKKRIRKRMQKQKKKNDEFMKSAYLHAPSKKNGNLTKTRPFLTKGANLAQESAKDGEKLESQVEEKEDPQPESEPQVIDDASEVQREEGDAAERETFEVGDSKPQVPDIKKRRWGRAKGATKLRLPSAYGRKMEHRRMQPAKGKRGKLKTKTHPSPSKETRVKTATIRKGEARIVALQQYGTQLATRLVAVARFNYQRMHRANDFSGPLDAKIYSAADSLPPLEKKVALPPISR